MLKNPNFLLSNQNCQSSSLKCQAHWICFQRMVYEMSTKVWKIIVHLPAVVSIKYGEHEETRELGFQANHRRTFPWDVCHASVCRRNAWWGVACHRKSSLVRSGRPGCANSQQCRLGCLENTCSPASEGRAMDPK